MNIFDVLQLILFVGVLFLLTPPLGKFMAAVFKGETTWLHKPLGWLERLTYKISGIDSKKDMGWKEYALCLMAFNILGIVVLFLLQLIQGGLPFNPQAISGITWDSALNTAVSFVTNTNWQGYAGETTMSYLTQMIGLAYQNFVSAAVGIAVAVAVTRGIARKSLEGIGNFWTDLTRSVIYILLPSSFVLAIVLVSQGVVQNFSPYLEALTLEGAKQMLPFGPAASQIAIKMLGTNGGGFFNSNSSHPFENPTAFSNLLQMLAIFVIPAALTYMFGVMTNAKKHGWLIFGVMLALFLGLTGASLYSEYSHNPVVSQSAVMEGKETRFGTFNSVLFSTVTTSASCGAVNSMHSSLSPLSGGVALFNMMLGEIIFGGVGAGLYGMLLFVLLTVFLSGLMVGRTPEYLGKKIEGKEMTMVIVAILAPCTMILVGSAFSSVLPMGLSSLANKGPHGFTEILYAFSSAAGNNGSAFAGLNANTPYYNLFLALAMFVGRFAVIIPILAVAGSLAKKKVSPPSSGTFEVDSLLFAVLLIGVILIVGALTFLPALSLGPIMEHILMLNGRTF
ncbi:potassium-transporting ATPase subunit KdpA [Pseudobdellovibrio exovorus]|uniref:Potassium-transporting ATPase potassium-binding subunit n=1 Tax=Pseudobdellovibrio exovorus JSS TaxID=1184267 RepID=M4V8V0_9BACT|nr:potassium-transporting ATPase subunit KdpA [Pseudobdellovibrio exovorus]AGH94875.1 potassium-transporting ATPase, A subunit [Pseudobdellovibrio exovorus JSS]